MHLRGRRPRWPSGNAADALGAGPGEAVAADGDRILVGSFAWQHIVKLAALRIDEDRAHLLVLIEVDDRRLGGFDVGPLAAVHVLRIDDAAIGCAPRGALGLRLLGTRSGLALQARGR